MTMLPVPVSTQCCRILIGDAMSTIEVKVPDIGDFTDVPVIEVLVKPGDTVKVEDSLVTLESDKATMDVPAPAAGVVKSLAVKVGDKVSEGALLLTLETTAKRRSAACRRRIGAAAPPRAAPAKAPPRQRNAAEPAPSAPTPAATAPARRRRISRRSRHRMPDGRHRLRPRRLQRRVPRRGPRPEDRADRALSDPRRRLPERRLHSLEGAAACGQGDRRSGRNGPLRRDFRQAGDRSRQAARLEGSGGRQAYRRHLPGWPSSARSPSLPASARFVDAHHLEVSARRQEAGRQVRAMHHCRRLAGGEAAIHSRRPARHRFDRCARARWRPRAHAGDRRRHHRHGDGAGVFGARREDHRRRDAEPADDGRGSRPGPAIRAGGWKSVTKRSC